MAPEWPAWLAASNDGSPDSERWRGVLLHRVRVEHADPAAAILDYARARHIDLIVIGAHGDRSESLFLCQVVEQAFLGRTAEQVVRHAPCPVAKVMMRGGGYPERVKRLLVPYDGSSLASLALAYARDLAGRYDARLDLLHVVEDSHRLADAAVDEEASRLRVELMDAFETTRGPAITAGFHVAHGHPERAIRAFVREHDVDLVVQGAHSDEGRDVLGIVASEVARTVPCSVLTVRETTNGSGASASAAPLRLAVGL